MIYRNISNNNFCINTKKYKQPTIETWLGIETIDKQNIILEYKMTLVNGIFVPLTKDGGI